MDRASIERWLLAGDPSIAWQTERDLVRLPSAQYERTRRRVAQTGWGAALLAKRARDGLWAGGLYTPKWTSTFYTLQLLALLGVGREDERCVESCVVLLDRSAGDRGAFRPWKSAPPDACVTATGVAILCAFGLRSDPRVGAMVEWLLGRQMADGGWNCRWKRGPQAASHASFHTTTSVLEALGAFEAEARRRNPRVARAAAAGREFMLVHHLYRSHRTGAVARHEFTRLCFPHWWKFDVLRGLDHFRAADAWDARLDDPLALLEHRRTDDRRWMSARAHPGRVWLRLEDPRRPSRWNTLRALRVLDWASPRRDVAGVQ
jgi:hypothetical protein